MKTLSIDGDQGEGGGQVLRTCLTLSLLYRIDFTISNIRVRRDNPGLRRQHLTCVRAAKVISCARVEGDELGSTELSFSPGRVQGGEYNFDIGSAGSTPLLFQTLLLPLLQAKKESRLHLTGGTHNPLAPTLTYLRRSFLPLLRRMGAEVEIEVEQWGFAPAGGGKWQARIKPSNLKPLELLKRGKLKKCRLISYCSGLPQRIGEREIDTFIQHYRGRIDEICIRRPRALSSGNLLCFDMKFEQMQLSMIQLGRLRLRAESVAEMLSRQVKGYLSSDAVLDHYLTDQIMLPMVAARGGYFSCDQLSGHASTNLDVIAQMSGYHLLFKPGYPCKLMG
ncbi:RNA 3'-terminal phosphate cyclase [Photobacterium sagamiensis]|uniref:RNA 3'-terminal phosphate cyclase n=1 Tax=Photobacterium sagamiensis TaxID=2910241 RepID=UPI003D0C40B0